MPPKVISLACRDDCVLSVEFDNGERGLLDMKPYLGVGQFKKLRDPRFFQTARIAWDTIAWDWLDLDRGWVYRKCKMKSDAVKK